jgi:hypothetical protein
MDDGFGIGLGLPAIGDNENLGYGKGSQRHRSGISVAAGNHSGARGKKCWHQGFVAAGRCGDPS